MPRKWFLKKFSGFLNYGSIILSTILLYQLHFGFPFNFWLPNNFLLLTNVIGVGLLISCISIRDGYLTEIGEEQDWYFLILTVAHYNLITRGRM